MEVLLQGLFLAVMALGVAQQFKAMKSSPLGLRLPAEDLHRGSVFEQTCRTIGEDQVLFPELQGCVGRSEGLSDS